MKYWPLQLKNGLTGQGSFQPEGYIIPALSVIDWRVISIS